MYFYKTVDENGKNAFEAREHPMANAIQISEEEYTLAINEINYRIKQQNVLLTENSESDFII